MCSSYVQPWLVVIGGRRLVVGNWRLVAVGGGWQRLVVGDWWLVAVGSGWRSAVGGGWWLAVGGWRLVVFLVPQGLPCPSPAVGIILPPAVPMCLCAFCRCRIVTCPVCPHPPTPCEACSPIWIPCCLLLRASVGVSCELCSSCTQSLCRTIPKPHSSAWYQQQ